MQFRTDVLASIRGRPPFCPQDLAGVLAYLGQARGVASEADQEKLPNIAELAFSLKSLIETGQVAEAAPHNYYDANGRSIRSSFSGVSQREFQRALAEYYQRLRHLRAWQAGIASWLGRDSPDWGARPPLVSPSPDGRFAGLLYQIGDLNMFRTVGLFGLLKSPPEKPTVLLRPPGFPCSVGNHSIQWLGRNRYCVVRPYLFDPADNGPELAAITFLDVVDETFAHYEAPDILTYFEYEVFEQAGHWVVFPSTVSGQQHEEQRIVPERLTWISWSSWRSLTGKSPHASTDSPAL